MEAARHKGELPPKEAPKKIMDATQPIVRTCSFVALAFCGVASQIRKCGKGAGMTSFRNSGLSRCHFGLAPLFKLSALALHNMLYQLFLHCSGNVVKVYPPVVPVAKRLTTDNAAFGLHLGGTRI